MSDDLRPRAERAVFVYDGVAIAVGTARAEELAWLAEVLGPAFDVRDAAADPPDIHAEVQFAIDPERFAAIERRGPAASGATIDGLILDDSTERFVRWGGSDAPVDPPRDAPRVVTARDATFPVFYEVGPGPRVRVTAGSGETSRVALMRVVREFAMDACLRRGELFLHAAAFCVGGRAVVLAGAKRSGKTTTLAWCLDLLEEARFLANDRVRIREAGSELEVRGMPTILSLRPESFGLLPAVGAAVRSDEARFYLSRREVRERTDVPPLVPFVDGRFGLSPTRLPELLGRGTIARAPTAALVFPEVDPGAGGLRARALGPEEAAERLVRTLFSADDLGRASALFSLPGQGPFPDASALRARARRIAGRVPGYVWRVGPDAPRDASSLARFVREIAGG